jgi:hypothetical protein
VIARLHSDQYYRVVEGRYNAGDIILKMAKPGDRSASSSISRALDRLAQRGLLSKHKRYCDAKDRGPNFYMLTETGLPVINRIRAKAGLEPLELVRLVPPMTDEEFMARAEAIHAEYDMARAQDAVRQLSTAALLELRKWIDVHLGEIGEVNTIADA